MNPAMIGGLLNTAGFGVQAIGGVLGGIFGSRAAREHAARVRAGGQQAFDDITRATNNATQMQRDMLGTATGYLSPFRDLGAKAGGSLSTMLFGGGDVSNLLKESALFKFQSELGSRNINRELAARGLYGSGAGLETLARFNNQLVGEEGQRMIDRLFNITQLGANSANSMAGLTAESGNQMAARSLAGHTDAAKTRYDSILGASSQQYRGAMMQTQGMQDAFTLTGQGIREFGQGMMGGFFGGGGGSVMSAGMGTGASANSWFGPGSSSLGGMKF